LDARDRPGTAALQVKSQGVCQSMTFYKILISQNYYSIATKVAGWVAPILNPVRLAPMPTYWAIGERAGGRK
jgi:hypothetical protein